MTTAMDPQGVLIQISASTTAEVYVTIGECRDVSITRNSPEIDVSNFDSTFREYLSGLPDGGAITVTCNLQSNTTSTGTGQFALQEAYNTNNPFRYQRLILDNSSGVDACLKWTGPITNVTYSAAVDSQWSMAWTARINSTSMTWAAST